MTEIWIAVCASIASCLAGLYCGLRFGERHALAELHFARSQRAEFADRLSRILQKDKPTTNGTLRWVFKVAKGEDA